MRAPVDRPVGRYGVAKNVRRSAATASSPARIAASCWSASASSRPARIQSPSCRSRSARPRQAAIAALRSGSRAGAGQSTEIANRDAAVAMPKPSSLVTMSDASAGSETGRMNVRSSAVEALASTELTTPAKSTAKATSPIETAARSVEREHSVPRQTKHAPTAASASWACRRSRIGPPNSTSRIMANEPNAANVAIWGSPMTSVPSAKTGGMTTAALVARRSAASAGSCVRIHCSTRMRREDRSLDQLRSGAAAADFAHRVSELADPGRDRRLGDLAVAQQQDRRPRPAAGRSPASVSKRIRRRAASSRIAASSSSGVSSTTTCIPAAIPCTTASGSSSASAATSASRRPR